MRGIEQIRGFLDEGGLDVAYISNPLSIGYVTGFHSNPHERLLGLVVDRDQVTLVGTRPRGGGGPGGLGRRGAAVGGRHRCVGRRRGGPGWPAGPGRDRGVRAQLQRLDPPSFAGRGRRAGRPRTADREGAGGEGQRRAGLPGHRVLGHRRGLDRAGGEGPAGAERARAAHSPQPGIRPSRVRQRVRPGCSRGRSRRCPTAGPAPAGSARATSCWPTSVPRTRDTRRISPAPSCWASPTRGNTRCTRSCAPPTKRRSPPCAQGR